MNDNKSPTALIICDGWGVGPSDPEAIKREGNAVAMARTPVRERLLATCPWGLLDTSGESVGLPAGQMGNSEVGHLTLGAGRVVHQDVTRIGRAIEGGGFFSLQPLQSLKRWLQTSKGALHLVGLCSDGGVHSDIAHLEALLTWAAHSRLPVRIHCILDGRDASPNSGIRWVEQLVARAEEMRDTQVATVSGRYFAMDRDRRWERTERAYRAIAQGRGETATSPVRYVAECYRNNVTDEFIPPAVIAPPTDPAELPGSQPQPGIRDIDGVLFFNFRADRARQLTAALTRDAFPEFERMRGPCRHFVAMTPYHDGFPHPVLFPARRIVRVLGQVLSGAGRSQLRMAETEKYPHVTYFFNGGTEEPFAGEDRHMVPSPLVATYDLEPEMSALQLTRSLLEHLQGEAYDFVLLNYANADMVGHTGDIDAAVTAVETVDRCVGLVLERVEALGGTALVTADHGNAEKMLHDGHPFTAHTTYPVHLILAGTGRRWTRIASGALGDVAPTVLGLMGIPKPSEMTGRSLLGGRNAE